MAHTAMSGTGTTAGDDPLQTAVWRLRSRGCWTDAAALLAPHTGTAAPALQRAALLVERCLYTGSGWADAEDALRTAEAIAHEDDERGAAACERGHLAYASTWLGVRDRADEARAALGRAAALLDPTAPGRGLLDFRRGLIAEHLSDSPSRPARPTAAPTRRRRRRATSCCSRSLGATWRDCHSGTANWPKRDTASPSRCD